MKAAMMAGGGRPVGVSTSPADRAGGSSAPGGSPHATRGSAGSAVPEQAGSSPAASSAGGSAAPVEWRALRKALAGGAGGRAGGASAG